MSSTSHEVIAAAAPVRPPSSGSAFPEVATAPTSHFASQPAVRGWGDPAGHRQVQIRE